MTVQLLTLYTDLQCNNVLVQRRRRTDGQTDDITMPRAVHVRSAKINNKQANKSKCN